MQCTDALHCENIIQCTGNADLNLLRQGNFYQIKATLCNISCLNVPYSLKIVAFWVNSLLQQ